MPAVGPDRILKGEQFQQQQQPKTGGLRTRQTPPYLAHIKGLDICIWLVVHLATRYTHASTPHTEAKRFKSYTLLACMHNPANTITHKRHTNTNTHAINKLVNLIVTHSAEKLTDTHISSSSHHHRQQHRRHASRQPLVSSCQHSNSSINKTRRE